ncbi:MAG: competence/damage-inducible protein A [Gemmataceae bacterium]|nr:competence/damage-inducible protein A [Gemmataceae bacterium]MDW8241924.1 competence/damage-inducible protein A [Thermogemmata sp.]
MRAEIIAVGTELSSGQTLDTNSSWLSQQLAGLGITTAFCTIVADDLHDLLTAMRVASQRVQLILLSGGLGPTQDDLTRDALAQALQEPLVEDAVALEQIRMFFASRGRPMPERNRVQALRPLSAELLPNPIGTAPGLFAKFGSVPVFALPGVPQELRRMYSEQVRPRLQQLGLTAGVTLYRKINTFGLGESAVEEKILDLTVRGRQPEVGITVSDAVVSLRIIARAPDQAAAQAQITATETIIRERLGTLVFGVESEELEDAVVQLLHQHKVTLATAESVTGGLVAHRVCRVPGASDYFRGGIVAYTDEVKHRELAVPWDLLQTCTAVSAPVAQAMADGVRRRFGVDLAVATTGFAGPTGGTPHDPIGTVYVALAHPQGTEVVRYVWSGERTEVMSRTARLALNLVRLHLLKTATT